MICVEVLVNGQPACTADGYVTFLHMVVHSGQYTGTANHIWMDGFSDGNTDLAPKLRAAMQNPINPKERQWLNREIEVGDEITIRIVDRPASS